MPGLTVVQPGPAIAVNASEIVCSRPRPEYDILGVCFGHEFVSVRLVPRVSRALGDDRKPSVQGGSLRFVPFHFHDRQIFAGEYIKSVYV